MSLKENDYAVDVNDELFYKLTGVMHFVDKFLDDDELEFDEVQRADIAREKILKLFDRFEKYRWHDLRKNPEDLPEKEKPLLAYVEEQNTYYCAEYELQEFISDEQYAFFEMGTGIELFYQPIAWRYIEPFVEDEE